MNMNMYRRVESVHLSDKSEMPILVYTIKNRFNTFDEVYKYFKKYFEKVKKIKNGCNINFECNIRNIECDYPIIAEITIKPSITKSIDIFYKSGRLLNGCNYFSLQDEYGIYLAEFMKEVDEALKEIEQSAIDGLYPLFNYR